MPLLVILRWVLTIGLSLGLRTTPATTLYFDSPVSDYFNSLVSLDSSEMPDTGSVIQARQITGIAIYSDRQMAQFDRLSWQIGDLYPGSPSADQAVPD